VHVPRLVLDDERHVQPGQRDCAVDVEEVHGQDRGGVRAQEGAPAVVALGRGRYPVGAQDLADGVPLENSIAWLICADACGRETVMVGWPVSAIL
jgi:hypothetical protein